MYQKKLTKLFKIILLFNVFFMLTIPTYGFIWENDSSRGYCDNSTRSGCESTGETASVSSVSIGIEWYIELGGGYFLNSYSNALSLMQRIELSNHKTLNPEELKDLSSKAIGNLTLTSSVYSVIISIAENTPYNPTVIDQLKSFDYDTFQAKTGLSKEAFEQVQAYLSNGDITGNYKKVYKDLLKLEDQLFAIDSEIQAGRLPSVKALWDLNERYSNILRFGQYVSRVFSAL